MYVWLATGTGSDGEGCRTFEMGYLMGLASERNAKKDLDISDVKADIRMVEEEKVTIVNQCGYAEGYRDTDSTFCHIRGENADECITSGMKIKLLTHGNLKGTVFETIGADIKENYMSILISSKKKYLAVTWDGDVETKGLVPVKKYMWPIVKFSVSKILNVINSSVLKNKMTPVLEFT